MKMLSTLVARRISFVIMAGTAVGMAMPAIAQSYPERPITVIVPFGPGGTTDLTARAFQKAFADNNLLAQPLVVANVTGGAVGSVGARQVLSSAPDGYTFLLHHLGMMSAGAVGTQDFSYTDFEPVAGTTDFCSVVVVAADSPYNSLSDMLTDAAAHPDTILYGANLGGNIHIAGLMLEALQPGADFRIVQIGAEVDNVTAIKGGIINATTLSTGTYTRYKAEGLKALADLAELREPTVPEVPTAKEQGYDMTFCVAHWWFAPKGTPPEVIDTFAQALKAAMDDPTLRAYFEERSTLLTFESGPEFKADLDATYEVIAPIAVRAAEQ
ncbi:Bug family tripartite tricarboxylate transporter substrate binding protein [Devosia beringensis]|uniref:Bug family tripartite tricarboxylate transporter substrate binding protein n=1 Tax=Devosia beringensis TaxID=2657486 RepID=UPI00186BA076|nr:tripartite tricarboxylate transporter substrate binding protein [Devosia beringensis]